MTIAEKIKAIVGATYSIDAGTLEMEARFYEDLDDSFGVLEAVMRCEEEFEIKISDEDACELNTIGELIVYMEEKLKQKPLLPDK